MKLPGYQVSGAPVRVGHYVIQGGHRDAGGAPVLLKGPHRQPASPAYVDALRRELSLRAELHVSGVLPAQELLQHEGSFWLVMDDPGAVPLSSLLAGGPLDLGTFFHLALKLCAVLGELHRRDMVHENVRPEAILVHPATHELWLDGFDLATRGVGDSRASLLPSVLAYASPEQTGRMNRGVDHRSDLYSLGVTLYELVCGRTPFRSSDPLELIHAHIAMTPAAPTGAPEPLARILLKLLEKTADARYQSAQGLRADLETCAREWSARRTIAPFTLGTRDVSDRFLIPQKLYGRDREVAELTAAFERACQGPPALTLVSGYSGVGKTSLIQELYRAIVRQRGYFISGKCDQVVRDIPYGALLQAFRGLVQQLLTETEERLAVWRARLLGALGGNGAVLTEVIPEIELIIGTQPVVPPLAPAEAQNRFRLAFQSFVGALARQEHPLVVFLDDLQWADAASLALLQPLLTSADLHFALLIGTYRDNEVDVAHPLVRAVDGLQAAGARVDRILLKPLELPMLTQLVGDCLRRDDPEIGALARLVATKTEGNPFFAIQFLKTLRQDGLLAFDHERRRWAFGLDEIARAPMTNNVIDLMGRKIQRLSPPTQSVLTLAACIGNPFENATLALVSHQSPEQTEALLDEAVAEGLMLRVSDESASYAFLHDRVRQAAYARLPEEGRQELHLRVGRLLRQRGGIDEEVFDIVGHLNLGRGLIVDDAERLAVAQLNLAAGRRAKSSTAYQAALGHFTVGLELLPEARWATDYALMFELEREAAQCEYLCGRFEDAEHRFAELLERARSAIDKAQVYDLRVVQHENLSRYPEAARLGREGLRLFGVTFPDDEDGKLAALEEEIDTIERLLAGRPIESLVGLPVMDDPETCMVMRLLTDTWAPAYISGDAVLPSLVSARMVSLSIRHGNTEDSAYGYVTHAIAVGPTRGDYRSAYEWGTLALRVNERFDDQKLRAKVHQQFNAHVTLWRRPLATCAEHAREACRSGLQNGDFTYAGYGAFTESWPAFLTSRDLERFVRDLTPNLALLERIRTTGLAAAHRLMLSWARALQGCTDAPRSLSHAGFSEEAFVRDNGDNPFFMTVYHVAKLHLALHHEDPEGAARAAGAARRLDWGRGTIWPVLLDVWEALATLAAGGASSPKVLAARDSLRVLAENCPENFQCFALLVSAELARVGGKSNDALDLYEEVIRRARGTESLQHEALAAELSGRLWLSRGNETAAAIYLGEARRRYREWGAAAKVRQLEERYPDIRWPRDDSAPLSLDAASVTKAAHALSVEIVLDELLRKLVRIAVENAGAERGLFLREKGGRLVIEAECAVAGGSVDVLDSVPLEVKGGLSRAVVQYVRNTGQSLVLGDAAADPRFAADPYIATERPRSILCVPVIQQGKLGGILYLENNLTAEAFTAERIGVLDVLCAQAAISLENARLYREVESLKNRLEAENLYLQEEIRDEHNFEEMVGTSPALLHVLRTVERIAPTDATVLISGETGTGKELIARAIHDRSRRRDRPLVKVNCGAIAAGLVESELFGHVKGAFTGALDKRIGRFELAHGGTLFLDEIGEVPLETQVKLLRVLQEQEFEPVGSCKTQRIDVRVIAATNRDLEAAIGEGRFRLDLFYRLNVLPLTVPPLRERRSDIPQLVAFFLARFSRRFSKALTAVSKETMHRLVEYSWPGNIRELQNVIERAVILTQGPVLAIEGDLLPAASDVPVARGSTTPAEQESASLPLDEVERRHILEVLSTTHGVIEGRSGAARILNLHPNTLRSRMKRLGITRQS